MTLFNILKYPLALMLLLSAFSLTADKISVGPVGTAPNLLQKISYLAIDNRIQILGATAILLIICLLLILFSTKSPLKDAQKSLVEATAELKSKNFDNSIKKIDSAIKSVKDAKSQKLQIKASAELLARVQAELDFISQDLEILEQDLIKVKGNKIIELLPYIAYISGIACVLGKFLNIEDHKNEIIEELNDDGESSRKYCVPYFSKELVSSLKEVIYNVTLSSNDLWFYWLPDDYEPIKIFLKNDTIDSALYRWHWQHIQIRNPYVDDKNRIHSFFIPYFHTPKIRMSKDDVIFFIFVNCFNAAPQNYEAVYDKVIPEYSVNKGTKDKHPPIVNYSGWPE